MLCLMDSWVRASVMAAGCFGGSTASLTPRSFPYGDGEGRAGACHAQGAGCDGCSWGSHSQPRALGWLRAAFSSWLNCTSLMLFYSSASNAASPCANRLGESNPDPLSLSAPTACCVHPPPTTAALQGCLQCLVQRLCVAVPSSALQVAAWPC